MKQKTIKGRFLRLVSFLFYEKGTYFGSLCSGFGVYPSGNKCYLCDDCEDKNYKDKE